MNQTVTVGELARKLGFPAWLVRIVVDKVIPDCPRVGPYRAISTDMIPPVKAELKRHRKRKTNRKGVTE